MIVIIIITIIITITPEYALVAQVVWSATVSPIVSLEKMKLLNFVKVLHLKPPVLSAGDHLHCDDDNDVYEEKVQKTCKLREC